MNCYRHPDREAYVRCQRCERFICPDCQVEAAVGFLCPDDAGGTPAQLAKRRARAMRLAASSEKPRVTQALVVINALLWLGQIAPGSFLTLYLLYGPALTPFEPWRMITAGFVHDPGGPMHILLNMYSIYIFGRVLEPMLGSARFLALYLISIFGGSVAVLWLSAPQQLVVGASGAFFGLMGAYFVVLRSIGGNATQLLGLIAVNLVFGFVIPGISWEGHLGGLATGAAVAGIYASTRSSAQKTAQQLGLIGIVLALVALTIAGIALKL